VTAPVALSANGAAPPAASGRGYLRAGLPAIYREGDFAMRFVEALETLLDPVIGVLDCLPAHFSCDLADPEMLGLMAAWLGVELDESWPEARRRELVKRSSALARRGTRAGLEEALRIAFPDLPLRVEEEGGVVHAGSPAELPPAPTPRFVVYCDVPLEEPAGLARMIEVMKPVHVQYRLRIRSPRPRQEG
jgi:phage tail-like protein